MPVYFLNAEAFADYYGLDLGAARGMIYRYVRLGYLVPAEAPDTGWTVHVPLPQNRRGRIG